MWHLLAASFLADHKLHRAPFGVCGLPARRLAIAMMTVIGILVCVSAALFLAHALDAYCAARGSE